MKFQGTALLSFVALAAAAPFVDIHITGGRVAAVRHAPKSLDSELPEIPENCSCMCLLKGAECPDDKVRRRHELLLACSGTASD